MKNIKEGLNEAYAIAGNNAYFGDGFKLGVEFAQRWISVEEETYPSHTQILVKTDNGNVYQAVYNSHTDKVTPWWGNKDKIEIYQDTIISWRPIERS